MRHSPEPFSVPLSVKAQVMAQGLDPIEATERADRKECSIGKFGLLEVEANATTSSRGYGGPRQCEGVWVVVDLRIVRLSAGRCVKSHDRSHFPDRLIDSL